MSTPKPEPETIEIVIETRSSRKVSGTPTPLELPLDAPDYETFLKQLDNQGNSDAIPTQADTPVRTIPDSGDAG